MILDTGVIGIPDWPPPFPYALHDLPRIQRAAVEALNLGLSDKEAWAFSLEVDSVQA